MIVTGYKTKKVFLGDNLNEILKTSLPKIENGDVVVVTSKIVSFCQGNVIKRDGIEKETIVRQQAEKIIKDTRQYQNQKMLLTLTNHIIIPSAGIDESNGNGYFVFWPKNPMKAAERTWEFLKKEYNLTKVGVLIIDSTFMPMRTGSISIGLSWCGFAPVKSYIGKPDIFGEPLKYTTTSFVDSLSIAAGICMGEGSEQTPLVVIKDIPEIEFVHHSPTKEEATAMHYPMEDDLYGPLLASMQWENGGNEGEEKF